MKHFTYLIIIPMMFLCCGCAKNQSIAPFGEWFEVRKNNQYYYGEHTHIYYVAGVSHYYAHIHRYEWKRHDHLREKVTYRGSPRYSPQKYYRKKAKKVIRITPRKVKVKVRVKTKPAKGILVL